MTVVNGNVNVNVNGKKIINPYAKSTPSMAVPSLVTPKKSPVSNEKAARRTPPKPLRPMTSTTTTPGTTTSTTTTPHSKFESLSSSATVTPNSKSTSTPSSSTPSSTSATRTSSTSTGKKKVAHTSSSSHSHSHLSLKQQLKQQIQSLKKQKQLVKLQKEAEERGKLVQKQQKEARQQQDRLLQQRDAERQRKIQERHQRDQERLDERREEQQRKQQRKQQEQALKQQQKERLQQQKQHLLAEKQQKEQERYQHDQDRYRIESEKYRHDHARWLQQRQRWIEEAHAFKLSISQQQQQQQQLAHPHMISGNLLNYANYYGATSSMVPPREPPLPSRDIVIAPPSSSSSSGILQAQVQVPPMNYPQPQPLSDLNLNLNLNFGFQHQQLTPQPPMRGCSFLPNMQSTPTFATMQHPLQMPRHLSVPPLPPVPPKKPRAATSAARPKRNNNNSSDNNNKPQVLCQVMEPPSPFASTHNLLLVDIVLIRSTDQPSFGVNLKSYKQSKLVDPSELTMMATMLMRRMEQQRATTTTRCKQAITQPTAFATKTETKIEIPNEMTTMSCGSSSTTTTTTTTTEHKETSIASLVKKVKVEQSTTTQSSLPKSMDASSSREEEQQQPSLPPVETKCALESVQDVNNNMDMDSCGLSPMTNQANNGMSIISAPSATTKEKAGDDEAPSSKLARDASTTNTVDSAPKMAATTWTSTDCSNNPTPLVNDKPAISTEKANPQKASLYAIMESEHGPTLSRKASLVESNNTTNNNTTTNNNNMEKPKQPFNDDKNAKDDGEMSAKASEQDAAPSKPIMDVESRPNNNAAIETARVGDKDKTIPEGVASNSSLVPKRRRRRRVNFTVMMVVDAIKQNTRHHLNNCDDKSSLLLLQTDDIIVSIGGTNIAGLTFAQACAIFSTKSEKVPGSETMIQAKIVVARRKPLRPAALLAKRPIVVPPKAYPSKSTAPTATELSFSSKGEEELVNMEWKPTGTSSGGSSALVIAALPKLLSLPANPSMNFSPTEIAVLADCVIQAAHHHHPSHRLLGQAVSEDGFLQATTIFRQVAALKECILVHRTLPTLQTKWMELTRAVDANLAKRARAFWSQTLKKEAESGGVNLPFSSDAERSELRQLPRPPKGCRCKSQDHEYLHDPRCSLYGDLRRRVPGDELSELLYHRSTTASTRSKGGPKDLNAVEKGFKDRIVKLKNAAEMEEAEARFVARMEEIQLKECKKAIFAPTLTGMILSTVFELQREFPIHHLAPVERIQESEEDEGEEQEVEEVALMALGKRKNSSNAQKKNKKQKTPGGHKISLQYLMMMLQYISKTWGHVYREPSHEEYAWRWELYHGHNSENVEWESQSTNPRQPNSLPFENVRFRNLDTKSTEELCSSSRKISKFEEAIKTELDQVLKASKPTEMTIPSEPPENDAKTATASVTKDVPMKEVTGSKANTTEPRSRAKLDLSTGKVENICLMAHLLSPANSGLLDELKTFVNIGILEINSSGIPVLAQDWASTVDIVLLDDMITSWGADADPHGRYCINHELRDTLEEQWVKSDYGWAMADDPDDLVFDFELIDEWRQTFEGRMEERAKIYEGIGRFGL